MGNSEERCSIQRVGGKIFTNQDVKEYLLLTEERFLGEASRNRVWGIGITLTDKHKLDPRHWNGDNLLGTTLVEVRQFLRDLNSSNRSPSPSPTGQVQIDLQNDQNSQGPQRGPQSSDNHHDDHPTAGTPLLNARPTQTSSKGPTSTGQANKDSGVSTSPEGGNQEARNGETE